MGEYLDLSRSGIIEASAGTGKTFTIKEIYEKLIRGRKFYCPDENDPRASVRGNAYKVEEILVCTFTNAATAELSQRIQEKIAESVRAAAAAGTPEDDAELVRLRLAEASFDCAKISTIDSFVQETLGNFAIECGVPEKIEIASDDEISRERELFAQKFCLRQSLAGTPAEKIAWPAKDALDLTVEIWKKLDNYPNAFPSDESVKNAPETAVIARGFAEWKAHREREWAISGKFSYDETKQILCEKLLGNADLAREIASRYKVVLVDEAQDTSPQQIEIFSRIFLENGGGNVLFFVGDPKQAIYSFRGGDLKAYESGKARILAQNSASATDFVSREGPSPEGKSQKAICPSREPKNLNKKENFSHEGLFAFSENPSGLGPSCEKKAEADSVPVSDANVFRLQKNWRSREGIVEGVNELFEAEKNAAGFDFRPCEAAKKCVPASGVPAKIPAFFIVKSGSEKIQKCAGTIAELLKNGVPADAMAVLCATNSSCLEIRAELQKRGVPAVFAGKNSVFSSVEARIFCHILQMIFGEANRDEHWRYIALALEIPARELENSTEKIEDLRVNFAEARKIWERDGLLRAMNFLIEKQQIFQRFSDKQRVSNFLQLIELTAADAAQNHLNCWQTIEHLKAQIAAPDEGSDEQKWRLPSSVPAVKICTEHTSKGLEYDIVFLPTMMDEKILPAANRRPKFVIDDARERLIFKGSDANYEAEFFERSREDKRCKNYVVLTRAKFFCVLFEDENLEHETNKKGEPIYEVEDYYFRELLERAGGVEELENWALVDDVPAREIAENYEIFKKAETRGNANSNLGNGDTLVADSKISKKVDLNSGDKSVAVPKTLRGKAEDEISNLEKLHDALLERSRKMPWRKSSFSGIMHARERANVIFDEIENESEELRVKSEELNFDDSGDKKSFPRKPYFDLPAGVDFGTAVHAIFEQVDFQNPEANLDELIARFGGNAEPKIHEKYRQMVLETLNLPVAGTQKFRDFDCARDVLRELDFDFSANCREDFEKKLGKILQKFGGIYEQTYQRHFAKNRAGTPNFIGILRGSIDAVLRDGNGKFFVVDWKTNAIDSSRDALGNSDLAAEIVEHGYALQWLFYWLALRAFLRERGAWSAEKLGGARYVFVRWNAIFEAAITNENLDDLEEIFR